jgi:NADP-dependent 3-hydroxy acid dehydrogenase YdfG
MVASAPIAVVTGASAGIGAATARALAGAGYRVVLGARRADLIQELARELHGDAFPLDVTDEATIERFVESVASLAGRVDALINNAGLALGLEPVGEGADDDWARMLNTNVLGLLRVTRACLPLLRRAPRAHIVNLGSVAGFEVYAGGAAYAASKHAVRAITRTIRLELNGEPIRVTEIDPGMVETEFSLVRFKGDAERAGAVYRGLQPLTGADIADCIVWAVTRPPHVNIDELVVRPLAQASASTVHRVAGG